ncbi:mitochondrial 54S ribosomal protein uL23m NDAI_0A04220 [Naumovozyma dairenensis CBS 421]|uniref:Large ribosomal subunit protein uL23m n=1 Tax=Naumovozyma dairenensis (strain ATCC 10597 / BCRC 20456 / CBS 421 / NBRC 0211 / NRRL Y-12639) TaxID=1071378 RepID=G0W441_NAUDC|nr:hypothetical protein NDAI_0A04220 [Naumovozyma dairenensis CBS 421]CCD22579.1 hypothetical protein NDAI_0A04220 [Naumovozyma dairenensis CBS 421]
MPRVFGTKLNPSVVGDVLQKSKKTLEKPTFSNKILSLTRKSIEDGKSHFRVGSRKLYFPKARVILLRPNAKHTPYQAKFIVPKSFNKLDLRDYLYHIYGLRAMNITTQLLPGTYSTVGRMGSRFRGPQIKKMTIDMEEPFVWPKENAKKEGEDSLGIEYTKELEKFEEDNTHRTGSDRYKPGESFDGVLGPYGLGAQPFIPKFLKRELDNKKKRYFKSINTANTLNMIEKAVERDEDITRVR